MPLQVSKQEGLDVERVGQEGVFKDVYTVAKNHPFAIQVTHTDLDLIRSSVSAELIYDFEDSGSYEERKVEYLKVKPLEYRIFPIDGIHNSIILECRIAALTSQHNDTLFLVKINVLDPYNIQEETFSNPIRVVSKPAQVRRIQQKRKKMEEDISVGTSKVSTLEKAPTNIRDDLTNESLTKAVSRLEEQIKEQSQLLQQIKEQQEKTEPQPKKESDKLPEDQFIEEVSKFIKTIQELSPQEREYKVRKIRNGLSPQETSSITEILGIGTAEKPPLAAPAATDTISSLPSSLGDFDFDVVFGQSK